MAVGAAAAVGVPWVTTGNAGLADANFIGTTDFVPFNVRVNNLRSGRLDPSGLNSSWGFRAGLNLSTTAAGIHGTNNTAIGASSLQNTADGSGNAALGTSTLQTNVSGNYNTALGDQALQKNTVSANTAVGFQSMFNNTTGIFNTATGYISLF